MDDSLLVRRGQALRDLHGVFDRLADGKGAARKPRAQRLALEQLGHDVRRAVVGAEVVDRGDVRMVQRPGCLRLLFEAPQTVRVLRVRSGQDLDRNIALQPLVARAIDLAHPARPDRAEDLVWPETGTRGDGHESRARL